MEHLTYLKVILGAVLVIILIVYLCKHNRKHQRMTITKNGKIVPMYGNFQELLEGIENGKPLQIKISCQPSRTRHPFIQLINYPSELKLDKTGKRILRSFVYQKNYSWLLTIIEPGDNTKILDSFNNQLLAETRIDSSIIEELKKKKWYIMKNTACIGGVYEIYTIETTTLPLP